ncbi:hypothetical protein [Roseicyclus marinus]|uniref:hypothetical protein n=1 Tax=Roseicyclus marinus TaxID=2161673 RepID=UPI0024109367|nr:hypothetical protein [Roseicyclus marinus]MDG3040804.1 hypothetical protein [Roseicyclus marinus]
MRCAGWVAPCVLGLLVPVLSGCGLWQAVFGPRVAETSAEAAVYRAAMADFSDCATTDDLALRAVIAARLDEAAGRLNAVTRPTDPDHFFMADRVSAAARYCAEAAEG